jgi:hypothetical protein
MMMTVATKPGYSRSRTRHKNKLLQPGWAGALTDAELEYIQNLLLRRPQMAERWGFRPGAKTLSEQAVRRVAMWGEPDNPDLNGKLARQRSKIVPRDGERLEN